MLGCCFQAKQQPHLSDTASPEQSSAGGRLGRLLLLGCNSAAETVTDLAYERLRAFVVFEEMLSRRLSTRYNLPYQG